MSDLFFEEIYKNLMSGNRYVELLTNVRFPCEWWVLLYDKPLNIFRWRNFGSSANPATKEDLRWILNSIFRMSPQEFVARYTCVPNT